MKSLLIKTLAAVLLLSGWLGGAVLCAYLTPSLGFWVIIPLVGIAGLVGIGIAIIYGRN